VLETIVYFFYVLKVLIVSGIVVSGIGFGIAVVWEAVNSHRDRQALRLALRRLDDATRARKEKPGEPVPKSGVWDHALDH
jgi:hypothetical protein